MCDIQRIFLKKIRNWKNKRSLHRQKGKSKGEKSQNCPNETSPLRYVDFYESERTPASRNKGLFVYDVPSVEHQTSKVMLEAFRRTLTPMDLSNDSNGMKIFWIDLLWRGQLPLYEYDHGGFHIPKRLKQTLNSRKFRVTVDTDFQVRSDLY